MKLTARILLFALLFSFPVMAQGATNKAGGACAKAGTVITISKEKYTCQLVKKKLIWVKTPAPVVIQLQQPFQLL